MITFTVNGQDIKLHPGDECIMPNGDIVAYLTGRKAEAHKILSEEHQMQILRTIDFVKKKYSKDE